MTKLFKNLIGGNAVGKFIEKILDYFFGEEEVVGDFRQEEADIIQRDAEIESGIKQLKHFAKLFCPKVVTGFNLFEHHNPVIYEALTEHVLKLRNEQSKARLRREKIQGIKLEPRPGN